MIVLGLPRTGTTFLHRLLAARLGPRTADGRWRCRFRRGRPAAPVGRAGRGGDAEGAHRLRRQARREVRRARRCMHLQNEAFFSWSWLSNYPVPTYTRWLTEADPALTYDVWLDVPWFVQSGAPRCRLTLKSPQSTHDAHIGTILDRVPQARIVWTHRDPAEVVPSFASLIESTGPGHHHPDGRPPCPRSRALRLSRRPASAGPRSPHPRAHRQPDRHRLRRPQARPAGDGGTHLPPLRARLVARGVAYRAVRGAGTTRATGMAPIGTRWPTTDCPRV